jgi:hypothetical protein
VLRALLLLLVLAAPAAAQPPDTTLSLPYERAAGQRYSVHVEKVYEEYAEEGGRELLVDRSRHAWAVEAEVRGSRPGGYALAWTYRPASDSARVRRPPQFEPRSSTLEHVRIVFAVDSLGRPQFVLNPLWIRSHLDRALEAQAPRTDAEDLPRLEAARRQAGSPAGLRGLFLQDADRLSLVHGRRYTLGRAVPYRADLANPYGPGTLPARGAFRLDSLRDGRAFISWNLAPDPRALADAVLTLLEEFAPGTVRLTPEEVARRFSVEERARFVVDTRAGWVLRAEFVRRIRSGGRTRVEQRTFITRPPG